MNINPDFKAAADSAISSALTSVDLKNPTDEILSKLPIQQNPEVLLKQKEAEALEKKVEFEETKRKIEEDSIGFAKEKLKELALQFIPIPKLPTIDPKIIQAALLAKKIKDQKKEKQKNLRANAAKAKEIYSYSMKPRLGLVPQIPKLPELPQLPELPELPQLPELPELPNIPNVPNLPNLPTLR